MGKASADEAFVYADADGDGEVSEKEPLGESKELFPCRSLDVRPSSHNWRTWITHE